MTTMSLRAYGRRRKALGLPGANLKSVQRAIEAERLRESVVRDAAGTASIRDPVLADREWAQATDEARRPMVEGAPAPLGEEPAGDSAPESIGEARRRKEIAVANLREDELRVRRGQLIEAAGVERRLVEVFTACKTKLLGIPTRARQTDPTLTGPQVALIDALVREALENLANGGGRPPAAPEPPSDAPPQPPEVTQ